ncbi:hypothetical protein ACWEF6_15940 [Amycolatopsis sp. NPDC004772]
MYAPEAVADTIVFASTHPRREIPRRRRDGRVLPRPAAHPGLTDALLSLRRVGSRSFRTTLPDNGTDNVDSSVDEPGQVHGSHPGKVVRRSAVTRLLGTLARPGDLLTAARRHG